MDRLAVREVTAAKMLDMPASKFRDLVAMSALPAPVRIGDTERWLVDDIRAILDGSAARPNGDIE